MLKKTCEWCGNSFIAQRKSAKCCSHKCRNLAYKNRLRFDGLRLYVLSRDNYQCQRCALQTRLVHGGLEHEDVTKDLIVHHKDRKKSNNDPDNLIALCKKCHLDEHRNEIAKNERQRCIICGESFWSTRQNHFLCDKPECKKKNKAIKKRLSRNVDHDEITCFICDKKFTQKHNAHKTCSAKCRRKYTAEKKKLKYESNKQKILDRQKRYYEKNKERIKAYVTQWRKDNPDKANEYNKKWVSENLDHFRKYQREYKRKTVDGRAGKELKC